TFFILSFLFICLNCFSLFNGFSNSLYNKLSSDDNQVNQELTYSNGDNFDPEKKPKKKKDWNRILGKKGENVYAHQLANAQVKSNKAVSLNTLNKILSFSGMLVSEETLNSLINMPRLTFHELYKEKTVSVLYNTIGLPHSKNQARGIYIFTYIDTNQKYVGSSSMLAFRLKGYLNKTHKEIGKLIPLIKEKGLSKFKLEVICLPYFPEIKPEIVLEQYYLLDPSFNLNTIRVANNPSGSVCKPLYLYNSDKSILYYFTLQQKDFISKLNINHTTFTKHLNKGTFYLGKYLFLRELIPTSKLSSMTLSEISIMLENDRVKYNRNKPLNRLSKPVLLIDINTKEEILFESIGKCIIFFKSKGYPVSQSTIIKRLNTSIPYHGYICRYK
uniref:hypothetical protein n=1 Tax=Gonatophragmium mori TaxID=2966219 RepID=UPI0023D858A9